MILSLSTSACDRYAVLTWSAMLYACISLKTRKCAKALDSLLKMLTIRISWLDSRQDLSKLVLSLTPWRQVSSFLPRFTSLEHSGSIWTSKRASSSWDLRTFLPSSLVRLSKSMSSSLSLTLRTYPSRTVARRLEYSLSMASLEQRIRKVQVVLRLQLIKLRLRISVKRSSRRNQVLLLR